MNRYRFPLLLACALAVIVPMGGCGGGGSAAPSAGSTDLSNLPEGDRLAEEQFQKQTKAAEAKAAAKAAKAKKR